MDRSFEGLAGTQLDCNGLTLMCREVHDFQHVPMPSWLINLVPSRSFKVKCIPSRSMSFHPAPRAPAPSSTFHLCPRCSTGAPSLPFHAMQMHRALTSPIDVHYMAYLANRKHSSARTYSGTQSQALRAFNSCVCSSSVQVALFQFISPVL